MAKRRRNNNKQGGAGVCHQWKREGSCKFGDECKFKHENVEEENGEAPRGNDAQNEEAENVQDGACVPVYDPNVDPSARGPLKRPRTVEERTFTEKFAPDGTTRVLEHPNGLLIVLLAQTHPVLMQEQEPEDDAAKTKEKSNAETQPEPVSTDTSYSAEQDQDKKDIKEGAGSSACNLSPKIVSLEYAKELRQVEVSGKRKHGAVRVDVGTVLVRITCSDGTVHEVVSPVRGRVMETNSKLEGDPAGLLPNREGYLAVLYQTPKQSEKQMLETNPLSTKSS